MSAHLAKNSRTLTAVLRIGIGQRGREFLHRDQPRCINRLIAEIRMLSGNTLAKSLATLKKAHGEDRVLTVSSKSENGVKTLWPEILSVLG